MDAMRTTAHTEAEVARRVLACIARAQAKTTPRAGEDVEMIDLRFSRFCENKALAKEWIDRLTVAAIAEMREGWDVKDGWWFLHGVAQHAIDPRTLLPQPPEGTFWPPKRISEMAPNQAKRPFRRRTFDADLWRQCMDERYPDTVR